MGLIARAVADVPAWVSPALEARMTMEQMFSATGLEAGQRKLLRKLVASVASKPSRSKRKKKEDKEDQGLLKAQAAVLSGMRPQEALHLRMRGALWKELVQAGVPSEYNPEQSVPLIGDVAFLRHLRGMYQAGVPLSTLIAEARRRHFAGIWPFQLVSAARAIGRGRKRGDFQSTPCPEVLPVLDLIFERVALEVGCQAVIPCTSLRTRLLDLNFPRHVIAPCEQPCDDGGTAPPTVQPNLHSRPPRLSWLIVVLQLQKLFGPGDCLLQDGQALCCAARHHRLPHGFLGGCGPYAYQLAPGLRAAAPQIAARGAFRLATGE